MSRGPTPGILVEESPGAEHPIRLRARSLAAFVGHTVRGPVNEAVEVRSLDAFRRMFGGDDRNGPFGACVRDYFENGGEAAYIVRVVNGGRPATLRLPAGDGHLVLESVSPGSRDWLRASVDYDNVPDDQPHVFNLVLQRVRGRNSGLVDDQEIFNRVSVDPESDRYVADVLVDSRMLRVRDEVPAERPARTMTQRPEDPIGWVRARGDGRDGGALTDYDLIGSQVACTGLFALAQARDLAFVCLPPLSPTRDPGPAALLSALRLCRRRRAMLVVNPPTDCNSEPELLTWLDHMRISSANALLAWPKVVDAAAPEVPRANCGVVAGMLAARDRRLAANGPRWSTPPEPRGSATLVREASPAWRERLSSHGVCLLRRRGGGVEFTGDTTLAATPGGAPVTGLRRRRLLQVVEDALARGTRWVVFEPPSPSLWAGIRVQVEAFLDELREAGHLPDEGDGPPGFVHCDEALNRARDVPRSAVTFIVGVKTSADGDYALLRVCHTMAEARVAPLSLERYRLVTGSEPPSLRGSTADGMTA